MEAGASVARPRLLSLSPRKHGSATLEAIAENESSKAASSASPTRRNFQSETGVEDTTRRWSVVRTFAFEKDAYVAASRGARHLISERKSFLFYPNETFVVRWHLCFRWMSLFMFLYTTAEFAFGTVPEDVSGRRAPIAFWRILLDGVFSVSCLFNVILRLSTAIWEKDRLEHSRKVIFQDQIRNFWLWVEVLGLVPAGIARASADARAGSVHGLSVLPLVRAVIFVNEWYIRDRKQSIRNASVSSLVRKLVLNLLAMVHVLACSWIALGHAERWPAHFFLSDVGSVYFAGIGETLDDAKEALPIFLQLSLVAQYLRAFHFALGSSTGLGVSVAPLTAAESIFAIILSIAGVFAYALIIGSFSQIITRVRATSDRIEQQSHAAQSFSRRNGLGTKFDEKIQRYFDALWERYSSGQDESALDGLSHSLRGEILEAVNAALLRDQPFFAGASPESLKLVSKNLRKEFFLPRDFIITKGESAEDMFFIHKGRVQVVGDGKTLAHLSEGDFFGEAALSGQRYRTSSVIAITNIEILQISCEIMRAMLESDAVVKSRFETLQRLRYDPGVRRQSLVQILEAARKDRGSVSKVDAPSGTESPPSHRLHSILASMIPGERIKSGDRTGSKETTK